MQKHSKTNKRPQTEDAEMGSESTETQITSKVHERVIKKAKRRTEDQEEPVIIDEETGEQIEWEDDSEDSGVHMDEQEIVQQSSDEEW